MFAETRNVLSGYVTSRPEAEIFNEDYSIKSEVAAQAYAEAFDTVMAQTENYCRMDTLDLELEYGLKGWLIQPNAALMDAVCGR